jgi:hypothetical protein
LSGSPRLGDNEWVTANLLQIPADADAAAEEIIALARDGVTAVPVAGRSIGSVHVRRFLEGRDGAGGVRTAAIEPGCGVAVRRQFLRVEG